VVKAFFVYVMTNMRRTTLYVGMTNSLIVRISQHRNGEIAGFTKRYNLNRMVYYEVFNDVRDAIAREKQTKGWSRNKKDELIATKNPRWKDLAPEVLGFDPAPKTRWRD
jgi:putative endonuclease